MDFKDRVFFGGNLGLQFGSYTLVNLAPVVGLKITKQWSAGTRISYTYYRVNDGFSIFDDHLYGASLFSRYFIYRDVFLHAEYEQINGDWYGNGERFNSESLMVGGGYLMRIGDKAGFQLSILFNILDGAAFSPYVNPIIQGGFVYGL